jgi:hypothetical protein
LNLNAKGTQASIRIILKKRLRNRRKIKEGSDKNLKKEFKTKLEKRNLKKPEKM